MVGDEDEEEERQPTSITRWLYEWALKYPRQTRPLAKGQPLRLLDDLCIEKDKVNEICDWKKLKSMIVSNRTLVQWGRMDAF